MLHVIYMYYLQGDFFTRPNCLPRKHMKNPSRSESKNKWSSGMAFSSTEISYVHVVPLEIAVNDKNHSRLTLNSELYAIYLQFNHFFVTDRDGSTLVKCEI